MPTVFEDDVIIQGDLSVSGAKPETQRAYLQQEGSQVYEVPMERVRVFDSAALLPAAATSDDLGLYLAAGGVGVGGLYIGTGDVGTGGCTRKARFRFVLPPEYVAAASIFIRAKAGMITTVADGSATIDFSVYEEDGDSTLTNTDLVTTAAMTINSETWANKDFVIDGDNLAPGDTIDVLMTITVVDTATGDDVIAGVIPYMCLSIKG